MEVANGNRTDSPPGSGGFLPRGVSLPHLAPPLIPGVSSSSPPGGNTQEKNLSFPFQEFLGRSPFKPFKNMAQVHTYPSRDAIAFSLITSYQCDVTGAESNATLTPRASSRRDSVPAAREFAIWGWGDDLDRRAGGGGGAPPRADGSRWKGAPRGWGERGTWGERKKEGGEIEFFRTGERIVTMIRERVRWCPRSGRSGTPRPPGGGGPAFARPPQPDVSPPLPFSIWPIGRRSRGHGSKALGARMGGKGSLLGSDVIQWKCPHRILVITLLRDQHRNMLI
ncbi:hypothetical protein NL676_022863 [Syzygium grande]|nr:hypothetical protein NL676_022863 [Syzygium grande]